MVLSIGTRPNPLLVKATPGLKTHSWGGLLVDERHYSALSNHINSRHLGQRLVYYRTGQVDRQQAKPVGTDSLVLKLNRLKNLKVDELQGKVVYKGPKTMVIIKS